MADWEDAPVSGGWEDAPAQKKTEPPKQRTVFGDVADSLSKFSSPVPLLPVVGPGGISVENALGVAEQLGAGLYGMGSQAYAGVKALGKATIAKAAGLPFGQTFEEEFNSTAKNAADLYVPLTPTGHMLTEKMGEVLTGGLHAYGEVAYRTGSPIPSPLDAAVSPLRNEQSAAAGAFAQSAAMLSTLLAPLGPKGKPALPKAPESYIDTFAKQYPETAKSIDASQVGKIKREPTQTVLQAVESGLNRELGLPTEAPPISLGDKIKMVVQKYGQDIPPADQIRLANSYVEKFFELQKLDDAARAEIPRLPAPKNYVLDEPITVDAAGKAATAAERAMMEDSFQRMTLEQRADTMGISPIGRLRQMAEAAVELKDIAAKSERPLDAAKARTAYNELKRSWASTFDYPLDTAKRTAALEEFASRRGSMSYNEALKMVGPRRSQRGAIEVEGLEGNVKSLQHLGEGVTKYAAAGLVKAPSLQGEVQLFRATRPGQDTALKPGAWVTNSADIASNVYAKGESGAAQGVVTPHTLNAKDLVEVHPGGYIYAPKGTDLGPLLRYKNAEGKPVTFADMLTGDSATSPMAKVKSLQGEVQVIQDQLSRAREFKDTATAKDLQQRLVVAKQAVLDTKAGLSKQRGSIEVEGLENVLPAAKAAAREASAKSWAVANPAQSAQKVEQVFDKSVKAYDEGVKSTSMDLLRKARRAVVAHDYDLRANLEQAGTYGQMALDRLVLQHGATMAAKTKMDSVSTAIFDKFSGADRKILDQLVRARRIVQIDKYKGVGNVRHEGGVTGPEALAFIEQQQKKLGQKYYVLDDAASAVFLEQKRLLDNLLEEGLIDKDLHGKMYNLDYQRTEYLDVIDPGIPIKSNIRNMPQSVRSSGIPELGRGKQSAVNIDAQLLLSEDVARVENRIARNRTLQALHTMAKELPANDVVKIPTKDVVTTDKNGNQQVKHVPEGWTALGVRIEGKQENILMRDSMAEQFIARPDVMPEWLATTMRWASGSVPLKATATAYNPSFVLAGMPMDIMHVWMSTAGTYSPWVPKYMAQMGMDLMTVSKDALTKTGRWNDAMLEGLGSSFMTHESRGMSQPGVKHAISTKAAKTKEVLAYLNEVSDMWVRLAHRERLIKTGMESWQATARARDRLDYFQGGMAVKAFDTFIPYLNVATQSISKVVQNSARNKTEAAIKATQILGTASSVVLANMVASPETWKQISTDDKLKAWNMTFGDQFFILDPNGTKRYLYIPMRVDAAVVPFNAAVVGGLEHAEYGQPPDRLLSKSMSQLSPLAEGGMSIPSIAAIASYAANYDFFRDTQIYRGQKVKPQDEVRTFAQGVPTSPIAQAAGQLTGGSPMRLEVAASKLINTNNFYIQAMNGAYKLLFEGADPRQQSMATMQLLQEVPGLRALVKLTSPTTKELAQLEKIEQVEGSKRKQQFDKLDEILFQVSKGQGLTMKDAEQYINGQPAEDRKQLADHAKYTVNVDKIMMHYKASDNIPSRTWWIASAKLPAHARAEAFYDTWISANAEERGRMMGIANSLQKAGTGYLTEEFQKAFREQQKLLGSEPR